MLLWRIGFAASTALVVAASLCAVEHDLIERPSVLSRATLLEAISRVAATVVSLAAACAGAMPSPVEPGGHQVLFIGNSLTETNGLPAVLSELAANVGDTIRVASVTLSGAALGDHLLDGTAARTIRSQRWELVVLQQGPSSLPLNRDSLIYWSRQLAPLIQATGARPALLMVWPESARPAAFDAVRDSYLAAAEAVGGVFIPAGEAWRTAWAVDPSLPLYGPDGFHPSALGTYLSALVLYERVTGRDARGLPTRINVGGRPLPAAEGAIRRMQAAAHETNARFPVAAMR